MNKTFAENEIGWLMHLQTIHLWLHTTPLEEEEEK